MDEEQIPGVSEETSDNKRYDISAIFNRPIEALAVFLSDVVLSLISSTRIKIDELRFSIILQFLIYWAIILAVWNHETLLYSTYMSRTLLVADAEFEGEYIQVIGGRQNRRVSFFVVKHVGSGNYEISGTQFRCDGSVQHRFESTNIQFDHAQNGSVKFFWEATDAADSGASNGHTKMDFYRKGTKRSGEGYGSYIAFNKTPERYDFRFAMLDPEWFERTNNALGLTAIDEGQNTQKDVDVSSAADTKSISRQPGAQADLLQPKSNTEIVQKPSLPACVDSGKLLKQPLVLPVTNQEQRNFVRNLAQILSVNDDLEPKEEVGVSLQPE